jgi:hypothetical protein
MIASLEGNGLFGSFEYGQRKHEDDRRQVSP